MVFYDMDPLINQRIKNEGLQLSPEETVRQGKLPFSPEGVRTAYQNTPVPRRNFHIHENYLKGNAYKLDDTFGGSAVIRNKGKTANLIDIHNRSGGFINSSLGVETMEHPEKYKKGLFRDVVTHLKETGIKSLHIGLQSEDTERIVKNLVKEGVLTNPRDNFGSSGNEHPTTFDIGS